MDFSTDQLVILFNIVYATITALLSICIFIGYKVKQPKYYGLLLWAFVLIIFASFFVGLYGDALEAFQSTAAENFDEEKLKENMISSLKILVFIVPGVMVAIAANLITEFLLTTKPSLRK